MRNSVGQQPEILEASQVEAITTLRLLDNIERKGMVSQRSLAARLGIAVGLTNVYIKRLVRKGLVKMQKVPSRRYTYFLTPQGFVEKSRLTAEYLSISLAFFRRARGESVEALSAAKRRGMARIVLFGASELAEIVTVAARESQAELVGVVAPGLNDSSFCGLPVAADLADLAPFDAVMLTDISMPQAAYDMLRQRMDEERILILSLLHVHRLKVGARKA
jgi:DNA-binding MarR family transcriptional regulator